MHPISDHPDVVIFPPVIAASALVVILLLHWLWPLDIFLRPVTFALGATLCTLGIGCAAWGQITLVRAGTNVSPLKPTTAIVTGGSFRFTRNPLYVDGTALLFGVSLLIGTWWGLIVFGARYFDVALWSGSPRRAVSRTEIWRIVRKVQEFGAALFMTDRASNKSLQRARPSRGSCNPRILRAGSLSWVIRSRCDGKWADET